MARTPSTMVPLGAKAPGFTLTDTIDGVEKAFDSLASEKGTVVLFTCNHCPFVQHIEDEVLALAREYVAKGVSFIAINSNDVRQYPDDAPDKMRQRAAEKAYPFPYLFDESQEVAKAFDAACTPDFFVYDAEHRLVYRGQFDDARPDNKQPITGADLRAALDALLAGREIPGDQKPSLGCNIKWKQ